MESNDESLELRRQALHFSSSVSILRRGDEAPREPSAEVAYPVNYNLGPSMYRGYIIYQERSDRLL